jgi:TRAP-type uncharacterized transport system fused permease subunit
MRLSSMLIKISQDTQPSWSSRCSPLSFLIEFQRHLLYHPEVLGPALVKLGVLPIAALMFVFYFGIISAVTPPVALAAYAGAGLAKAPPGKTGYAASKLAISGFILPYMFIYGPELLMVGKWPQILWAAITSTIGVFLLAASIQGYLLRKASWIERILLGLLLIKPGLVTDPRQAAIAGLEFRS